MNDKTIYSLADEVLTQGELSEYEIAVLIPCYNEEKTIAKVIRDFRKELPSASIYVFDNNSSDRTVEEAKAAGAVIRYETRQGKGFVVQSMFEQVEADFYIMVDGDDTYPADKAKRILKPLLQGKADTVIGSRLHKDSDDSAFKAPNWLGNKLFLATLRLGFQTRVTDMLSGYRSFTRRFVKSVNLLGGGFEIETELTIRTAENGFRALEVPINLTCRPEGSFSKIRPIHDGLRIMGTLVALCRDHRPLHFFGTLGLIVVLLGMIPGGVVLEEFFRTGLVQHLPSAVLAVGLVMTGVLTIYVGIMLYTISRRIKELDRRILSLTTAYAPANNRRRRAH